MTIIGIVGMGPRGSSLLERLITHIIETDSQNIVEIFLFEKEQEFGPGCHYTSLPGDLLTNTIAGQMTMYFGDEMKAHGPVHEGDCLYDWHRKNRNTDTKINDYLTRRELGGYLHDFYIRQIARMKKLNIRFHQICEEVVDVISYSDWVEIHTEKSQYIVSQTILCIGHQASDLKDDEIYDNFLDYDALERIECNQSVAIQGMGLSACDVISRFTEGRGGRYERVEDNKLRYVPSGKEPKLHLFSRSGIFLAGRAHNPDHNFIYSPIYFTKDNIEALRRSKGALDFDSDVLPLLKQELEHAYAIKTGGKKLEVELFLNPEKRIDGMTQDAYRNSFLSYLRWDIEECAMGKLDSAYKFCQDAIRDMRDQFRAMIDFRGLSDESYHRFQSYWQAKLLKICVGPPYIRLMQIEALIEAGICSIDHAFNPRVEKRNGQYALFCDFGNECKNTLVDHVVKARTPSMNLCDTPNPLTCNLLRRFKPFIVGGRQYGGLEINHYYEVHHADGEVCYNTHAFGIPSEGSKYFTLVLGRPNMVSTFLLDSNNLAEIVLDKIFTKQKPLLAVK